MIRNCYLFSSCSTGGWVGLMNGVETELEVAEWLLRGYVGPVQVQIWWKFAASWPIARHLAKYLCLLTEGFPLFFWKVFKFVLLLVVPLIRIKQGKAAFSYYAAHTNVPQPVNFKSKLKTLLCSPVSLIGFYWTFISFLHLGKHIAIMYCNCISFDVFHFISFKKWILFYLN